MNRRSVCAVAAGVIVIIAVTTVVDIVLHLANVYPPMNQPIDDRLALLATAYRVVISIGGAWLTARLALVVLAVPQCWAGGKLFELRAKPAQ